MISNWISHHLMLTKKFLIDDLITLLNLKMKIHYNCVMPKFTLKVYFKQFILVFSVLLEKNFGHENIGSAVILLSVIII